MHDNVNVNLRQSVRLPNVRVHNLITAWNDAAAFSHSHNSMDQGDGISGSGGAINGLAVHPATNGAGEGEEEGGRFEEPRAKADLDMKLKRLMRVLQDTRQEMREEKARTREEQARDRKERARERAEREQERTEQQRERDEWHKDRSEVVKAIKEVHCCA